MYPLFKRLMDWLFSIIALLILAPLLIPIAAILRFTGEGEIFYFQKRIGYKNQYFNIWKFATMLKNSPNMGTGSLTVRNDPRVLPVGKFLRKTKINELPQLLNVFYGSMSFVGPRPQMEVDFLAFPKHVQEKIYVVKPGITGIGSIVFRDEEKFLSNTDLDPKEFYATHIAPYKGELELWYQRNYSFFIDLTIIFLTLWVVVFPESDLVFRVFRTLPKPPSYLVANFGLVG